MVKRLLKPCKKIVVNHLSLRFWAICQLSSINIQAVCQLHQIKKKASSFRTQKLNAIRKVSKKNIIGSEA